MISVYPVALFSVRLSPTVSPPLPPLKVKPLARVNGIPLVKSITSVSSPVPPSTVKSMIFASASIKYVVVEPSSVTTILLPLASRRISRIPVPRVSIFKSRLNVDKPPCVAVSIPAYVMSTETSAV